MTKEKALNRLLAKRDDGAARDELLDGQATSKWKSLHDPGRLPEDTLVALLKVYAESSDTMRDRTVPRAILARAARRLAQHADQLARISQLAEEIGQQANGG